MRCEASSPVFRLRELVSSTPQVTFDELDTSPKHIALAFEAEMDGMLSDGWERDGVRMATLSPPVQWHGFNRSFLFHIHAWEPLTFLLKASCVVPDPEKQKRYFDASHAFAMDWLRKFQFPVLHREPAEVLAEADPDIPAWYDMGVGQRICRLAFLLDGMCRDTRFPDDEVELVHQSLHFHHEMLLVDGFFKEHSNHGLYQALGQLAAAKRFMLVEERSASLFAIASERLSRLLDAHFTADNVHKEHSPGYHYMILGSLVGAEQTDLIRTDITGRVALMEEALAWMIQPDHCLTTFGDSDPRRMGRSTPSTTLAERFLSPELRYIISQHLIGSEPRPGVKPYLDAGYAFARMYAPGVEPEFENASYLAQMAAFHSRVHKHADHLTFIWFDRGRDILVDPGRYAYAGRTEAGSDLFNQGFWYADPKRIYVESTRAHNCVEIDDRSYPRRNVKPWGSALRYAGEQDGLAVTDCDVVHERTIRHRRVLVMGPGHFLLVLDWLNDRTGDHDYRQWFQFAPDWVVEGAAGGYRARIPARTPREPAPGRDSAAEDELSVFNLIDDNACAAPVRGQEEPRLQGWMSDAAYSLIPSTSICVEGLDRQMGRFATLFVFGGDAELDRAATRFNISLRTGSIAWRDGKGKHVLKLAMQEPGDVKAILETVS